MVLAGLVTFVLVSAALGDRSDVVAVVYAGEGSAAGSVVPEMVEVPAAMPGVGHFAGIEDLDGKVLARSIPPGQPIMKTDLIDRGRLEFRSLAVPVDRYQLDGLDLRPLDRVDVVGFDSDDQPVYLATDLQVVTTSGGATDGFGTTTEGYLTVQVDELDALRLSLGQQHGPLHVVRSTGATPLTRFVPLARVGVDERAGEDRP
jgi:hypothetical protein